MNFKHHLETAWNQLLGSIVALILMTLVMFGITIITLGILAPVMMAGYLQSLLLLLRTGREPDIRDLFSQMRLFAPLLAFSIVVVLITLVGFMLLIIPGFLITFALCYVCIYMLPLMTDRQLGLLDALQQSYTMAVKDNPSEHLVVVVLYLCVLAIGGSIAIGSIFTTPFAALFIMSVYDEKVRRTELVNR